MPLESSHFPYFYLGSGYHIATYLDYYSNLQMNVCLKENPLKPCLHELAKVSFCQI